MTDPRWAYLAGIIDGEGSFGVYSAGTRLSVTNTYRPLLAWIQEFTGTGRIWEVKKSSFTQRPCYQWDCAARAIRVLLPQIIPYLIVKRTKAELFLEYLQGIDPSSNKPVSPEEQDRRERLIKAMRACMEGRDRGNEKGK